MQTAHCARMRSKTGYAEFGYFHCYLKMDAPRALVFRPLVKGNEALGTRLGSPGRPGSFVPDRWPKERRRWVRGCIAPRRTRGSDDGCHTTEPSFLCAWILVVMFCSGLPVKQGHLKDSNAEAHSVTAPA